VRFIHDLVGCLWPPGGRALTIVRAEAAAAYVSCVMKVRQTFVALLSLAIFLLLTLAGFVLIHVAVFAWLPWSLGAKRSYSGPWRRLSGLWPGSNSHHQFRPDVDEVR